MSSLHRILPGALAAGFAVTALPACDHAEEPSLRLASAPLHLILIEDEGSSLDAAAAVDALDPSRGPLSQSAVEMVIEDDPSEDALASADQAGLEGRTRRFLLALAGTAGAVDAAVAATTPEPATAPVRAADPKPSPATRRGSSRAESNELARGTGARVIARGPTARLATLTSRDRASTRPRHALEPQEIRRAIVRQLPRVRACYERVLKAQPQVRGRLVLSMSVKPSGEVINARVSDDGVGSEALAACVEDAVASWTFPRGTDMVAVDYPVTLRPTSGGW